MIGDETQPAPLSGSSYLDLPRDGAVVFAECISISGWFFAEVRGASPCRVRAWLDRNLIGETELIFVRPDVCAALQLPPGTATGFRLLANAAPQSDVARAAEISVTVSWSADPVHYEIGKSAVRLLPGSLAKRPYGDVVHPTQTRLLHRENIYGSGPPVAEPGAETLHLLQEYLPPTSSVVDIGCGAGAYGPALIDAGHPWLGLEVNPLCLEMLSRRDLPHRKVAEESGALPCRDGEFENAICVEVLEHIEQVDAFLGEIARVIRGRALFSVPNIEVIPYFSAWQVVPWHLLEGDHKNFFTRASLHEVLKRHFPRVEVFSYAEHPLRTPDGVPLHIHLFAVAGD